ncbi:YdcF family protein [Uliginosibacterium sp. H3]|uniref:YdcF family protein n=1 Tax=Uliginosibacterium silvisoli TaxID=3114758 RepID=A0ABU6K6E9_9RHOO|nr:YdcF family protein [Uliginosibacterium sp. H3]
MTYPLAFVAKKWISLMLAPPALPFLITASGLLLLRFKPRTGKTLAWSGLLLWLFLSSPFGTNLLTEPLESYPPISAKQLTEVQAIVILAGGQRHTNEEFDGGPTVNRLTLERVRYGARLARETTLPILVSGGAPTGLHPESVLMAETLRVDFNIEAKWAETRSLDTEQNALNTAAILKQAGISRIALVTHAAHMRRAVGEFEAAGLTVTPAPMGFMNDGTRGEDFFDYWPSISSAYTGWYALHEWLGIAAQKIRFWRK